MAEIDEAGLRDLIVLKHLLPGVVVIVTACLLMGCLPDSKVVFAVDPKNLTCAEMQLAGAGGDANTAAQRA
jgi:hypothetical protein